MREMKRKFEPEARRPMKRDYSGEYTMVTRSPSGPAGPTEVGFVAAIGSNVFVSRPEPGKPLPVCYRYSDDAQSSQDGWRSDKKLQETFFAV